MDTERALIPCDLECTPTQPQKITQEKTLLASYALKN
jgi:hypothetical protein